MDLRTYAGITIVNLTVFTSGIAVGITYGNGWVVHAQQQTEQVTPGLTVGTAAFGTLLVGRLAADQIMSHGIDMGKLNENILNLLASKPVLGISQSEIQGVIDRSRVTPLVLKIPEAVKPPAGNQKEGKQ